MRIKPGIVAPRCNEGLVFDTVIRPPAIWNRNGIGAIHAIVEHREVIV